MKCRPKKLYEHGRTGPPLADLEKPPARPGVCVRHKRPAGPPLRPVCARHEGLRGRTGGGERRGCWPGCGPGGGGRGAGPARRGRRGCPPPCAPTAPPPPPAPLVHPPAPLDTPSDCCPGPARRVHRCRCAPAAPAARPRTRASRCPSQARLPVSRPEAARICRYPDPRRGRERGRCRSPVAGPRRSTGHTAPAAPQPGQEPRAGSPPSEPSPEANAPRSTGPARQPSGVHYGPARQRAPARHNCSYTEAAQTPSSGTAAAGTSSSRTTPTAPRTSPECPARAWT